MRIGKNNQGSELRVQGSGEKVPRDLSPVPCPRYPKKGFTLIEVLLAVSILAIGLVGVLRAYSTSTMAMEKFQYDMDAVFLLKLAMGQIEEKAITQGEVAQGVSNGEFTSVEETNLGTKRSGRWFWSQEVQKMDLPSKKDKEALADKEIKPDKEEEPEFFLNKVRLAVANSGRSPLREVVLETYAGAESVEST